jgi:small redox-active disulfide protein 2
MKIEILGPGCKRCEQLYENAESAVTELASPESIEVVKVRDIAYFTKMGVFMTPGMVMDGETVSVGKVLSVEEIKEKIREII